LKEHLAVWQNMAVDSLKMAVERAVR